MNERRNQIGIVNYPGALPSAVLGLGDVLGYAASLAVNGHETDLGLLEIEQEPQNEFFSALVLPPSAGRVEASTWPWLIPFLKAQHQQGAVICSACTGLHWVAAAGLAQHRRVTTHWALEKSLCQAYPDLVLDVNQLLIEYADLITAGGLMAWTDLSLALIERFLGYDIALRTARHFVIDMYRRDQRPYRRFLPELRHGDREILAAQHAVEHLGDELPTIRFLAGRAGLSQRTFLRRFKSATGMTPSEYIQRTKIETACRLLLETREPVSGICYRVGYNDVPSFVRLFTKWVGVTPGMYRRRNSRMG